MVVTVFAELESLPLLAKVFAISLIPALLTSLGGLPVLFKVKLSEKRLDIGLGFAAGVMLVASFTSLLLPALEMSGVNVCIPGFIAGVLLVKLLDKAIPHIHLTKGYEGPSKMSEALKKAWLIALAMIIHNIPEGMAVGAAVTYSTSEGFLLALAIGIQDIPEGLAVAMPIASITGKRKEAFLIGAASGLVEAAAALIPPLITSTISLTLPLMLALASGSMIYVVVHEIVPDIYGHEHDEESTIGFFAGFLLMLILDTIAK